ncbi:MAG: hypoxanthine phosphoribosyltransferase [Desulfovibrionaceae bacterium]|nr:hypoxanthine phosphoribosyltransferase [Desulfovibrionaceae bacterium]
MRITKVRPLFTHEMIAKRVAELSDEISAIYKDEPLIAVCVLKGAVIFFSDLVRGIHNNNMLLGFLRMSSYGKGMDPGEIKFEWTLGTDIRDKHVLIVEDVVDTGHSMHFLLNEVRKREPRSVRLAALVDKHERRDADVHVDFAGFQLSEGFIVGYGLDHAEHYRALPDICVVEAVED